MQIKKIALAALAAVSFAPAFAAVDTETAPELVFMAWNSKGTYAKDLGLTLQSISGVKTFDFAGAKWNEFLALGGSDTQWTVASVGVLGEGFDKGDINYYAAFTDTNFIVTNQRSNEGSLGMQFQFNNMSNAGGSVANHEIAVAVGGLGDISGDWANFSTAVPSNAAIGATSTMARVYTSNDDGGAAALIDVYTTTANFTGTTLTVNAPVVAVPEPSTYALLMAGLLAVGFVARRRQA